MRYFVTAIGTDSGKTIVSAILLEALKADYWKPIQAGEPSDTDTVKELVSNTFSNFHCVWLHVCIHNIIPICVIICHQFVLIAQQPNRVCCATSYEFDASLRFCATF